MSSTGRDARFSVSLLFRLRTGLVICRPGEGASTRACLIRRLIWPLLISSPDRLSCGVVIPSKEEYLSYEIVDQPPWLRFLSFRFIFRVFSFFLPEFVMREEDCMSLWNNWSQALVFSSVQEGRNSPQGTEEFILHFTSAESKPVLFLNFFWFFSSLKVREGLTMPRSDET